METVKPAHRKDEFGTGRQNKLRKFGPVSREQTRAKASKTKRETVRETKHKDGFHGANNRFKAQKKEKVGKDLYVDGTAYVDAINYNGTAIASTAAELNIVDGDTSATSTTVADADRVVLNDGGTMKQVAVTDLAAYFDDEITAMPNLTSVGTLTGLTVGFGLLKIQGE